MPHSPRLYQGQLSLLESGHGSLIRFDPISSQHTTIATLPGFTRGFDCFAGYAFMGISQIRETAVFGGLPLQHNGDDQRCGLAVVHLSSGAIDDSQAVWLAPPSPIKNPALIGCP
jgi:uncharacterized protein (TIGR03032 family)